ncbi:MAG: hypothetical protein ACYCWE_09000 [Eubacteriales bacterium]
MTNKLFNIGLQFFADPTTACLKRAFCGINSSRYDVYTGTALYYTALGKHAIMNESS